MSPGRAWGTAVRPERRVPTRPVLSAADEEHDDEEQQDEESDEAGYLHPPWCADELALWVYSRRVAAVGVLRPVSHLHVLLIVVNAAVYETLCHRHRLGVAMRVAAYSELMPRLWNATIATHRRDVRDAVLDTTAALVSKHGLRSVTMSQIADESGIGRATLYKYFAGVEAILLAWHERQITAHLESLAQIRDQVGDADKALGAVLEAYALISHEHHGHHNTELAAFVHRDEHVAAAQAQLRGMIRQLISEAARAGEIRDDVSADELVTYCLHALAAASSLTSKPAVRRLVAVTLDGLRPSD